jgi:hypothetical protein
MWRSFFLAIGLFVAIVGAQCLAVDKFVLKSRVAAARSDPFSAPKPPPHRELSPPEWIPWSLLSTGAVVCIYSFSLPKRMGK